MSVWPPVLRASRVALGCGLIGGLLLVTLGCSRPEPVPTLTLTPGPFVHRVTAEGVLASARVTPINVPPEVRGNVRVAWLADEGAMLQAGDLVARFDDGDMKERLTEGRSEMTTVSHRMTKGEVEGDGRSAEITKNFQVAELELDVAQRFQLQDDNVFSRHEIVESQIDESLAGERRDHAVHARSTHESLSETNRELLAIEARKATMKIDQAESGLQALEVRAPHDGLLTLTRNWRGEPVQVGAELWTGQSIGEIPDLATLESQVYVLEADAGGLEAGRRAQVIVEAHPDTSYAATITKVDAVAKPRFRGSPVQYFGVTLAFDEGLDTAGLKPGQRVRATLVLAEKDDVLVVPRQAVFDDAGENRVWVRQGARFVGRAVEVGASSMGLVELVAGVDAGEEVALAPPSQTVEDVPAANETVSARAPTAGQEASDG